MSEDRGAKRRLKRPRAAAEPRPSDQSCSCFEEKEQSESAETWKLVLQAACPDLRERGWSTVPSLPDSHVKHAGNEKKLRKPETFTVGLKHFEWTAFPSFLETDSVRSKNPYVCGSLDRERITLEEEWNLQREESLTCIAAPSEVEKRLGTSTVEVYAKARKQENPSKQLKLQCLEKPVQKQQRPRTTGGISSSRLTSSENVKQSLGVGCNSKWNPEQDKAEKIPRGETLQTPKQEQKMVTEEAAGTTAKGGGSERVTEVTASLQSCPMCLVQFTERLTQLDMDSHLAKCLSESTEDILW